MRIDIQGDVIAALQFVAVEVSLSTKLFFVLNRCADHRGVQFVPTYKSKALSRVGGVVEWDAFEMMAGTICRDDHHRPIRVEVFE